MAAIKPSPILLEFSEMQSFNPVGFGPYRARCSIACLPMPNEALAVAQRSLLSNRSPNPHPIALKKKAALFAAGDKDLRIPLGISPARAVSKG